MDEPADWLLIFLLTSLEVPILVTLGWVSKVQDEAAGKWWVLCGVGVVTTALVPVLVPPEFSSVPVDVASPILSWCCYRGATTFSKVAPFDHSLGLALAGMAAWCVFYTLDLGALRVIAGPGVSILFLLSSIRVLRPRAESDMQRLLAAIWILPIGVLAARPLMSEALSPVVETEIWLVTLIATGLMAIGAFLERRTKAALAIAEDQAEQLRIGSEIASLGTWSLREGSDQLQWTRGMYRIYELDPEDGVQSLSFMRSLLVEEDRERCGEVISAALRNREDFDLDFKSWTGKGNLRTYRSRGRSVLDPSGRWNFVGTTMDVSPFADAVEELARFRTDLEEVVDQKTLELDASQKMLLQRERLASVGTLTAGLAHQMNNPVGAILAAAEFASIAHDEGDEGADEMAREALGTIVKEAQRCGDIVRNMMQFASERPSEKKPVRIDQVLEEVCQRMRRIARESGAQLTLKFEGASPFIHASSIHIEQALGNLVENALQSRDAGCKVEIERRVVDGHVEVTICDNGVGIASNDLPHVLDPFFTTRLGAGGTGLGMSVAHGIVADHNGTISVASEEASGVTVTVVLPLC